MITEHSTTKSKFDPEINNWFSDMIAKLKVDQLLLETGTAGQEKEDFYKGLIFGSSIETNALTRINTSHELAKSIFVDYLQELGERVVRVNKLAFSFSSDCLTFWAEVNDDDWESEKNLVLAAAKTNSIFYPKAEMAIETEIVEASDNCTIPPHYIVIKTDEKID